MDSSESQSKTVDVKFSGKGDEFFGIFIVNILLSILTLGIYSAWATVRNKNYFYSNTSIDNHNFTYLAKPIEILIGRIIAIICVVIYFAVSSFNPILGLCLALGLLLLTPWIINSSLRFEYRMSRYRNVCFSFGGSYGKAFIVFILLPILSVLTLYIALPWALKKIDEYLLSNVKYGDKELTVNLKTSEYYKASLWVLLASIVSIFVLIALPLLLTGSLSLIQDPLNLLIALTSMTLFFPIFILGMFLLMSFISSIYAVRIRNHILSQAEFESIASFNSTMKVFPFATLMFTNFLAIICSLGLAFPWALIRSARFNAENTQVHLSKNADRVFNVKVDNETALGGELSNAFDLGSSLT